jgi:ABC-type glycerol-3-phosphate transport system substrate-binding protein
MKYLSRFLMVAFVAAGFALPAAAQSQQRIQIKWLTLDWNSDEFKKQFEADNPGYELVTENLPFNNLFQQAQIRLGAKSDSFDVLSVDVPLTAGYGLRRWLEPLDDAFTAAEKNDWLDASRAAGTYKGKLISAPISTSTQLLFYNKDLLKAAGIPFPKTNERLTYEAVAELAKKVVKATPSVSGFTWEQTVRIYQLGQLAASLGGKMIANDGLTVKGVIDSPQWLKAFTFYQSIFKNNLGPLSDTIPAADLFKAGKIGFLVGGPWNIPQLNDAKVGFQWGISRTPYFKEGVPATPTGSWHIGVNPNSKNKQAAKLFVHYISTGKGAEYWWRIGSGDMPAVKSVLNLFKTDPQFDREPLIFMRTAADEATVNPVPRAVSPGYLEYEQNLQNTFQDIRTGTDVKQALDQAVTRISAEMNKYSR